MWQPALTWRQCVFACSTPVNYCHYPQSTQTSNNLHTASLWQPKKVNMVLGIPYGPFTFFCDACEIPEACWWDKNKIMVLLPSAWVNLLIALGLGWSGLFITIQRERETTEGCKFSCPVMDYIDDYNVHLSYPSTFINPLAPLARGSKGVVHLPVVGINSFNLNMNWV